VAAAPAPAPAPVEEVVPPPPDAPPAPTPWVKTAPSSSRRSTAAASTPALKQGELDEPAQAIAGFFTLVQKGQVEEAYEKLTKGSQIAEHEDEVKTLKTKTSEALELFGPVHGYEQVENKSVGMNLTRRTYISLGRDFPLRWRFYFYRSSSSWRLVDIRVDDRLTGIFDEVDEKPGQKP
jgi:hypothetical protein